MVILGVIGPWQVVIILVVVLLLFGGRKIPELMKGLGQGMNEFKKALNDGEKQDTEEKKNDKKVEN
jgi:sec-independent protein translocase protein TatA